MIRLTSEQQEVYDTLALLARNNAGNVLTEFDVMDHDEDVVESLFRSKVLVRVAGRANAPQNYRLDSEIVFSTDPEVLKQQEEKIRLETLLLIEKKGKQVKTLKAAQKKGKGKKNEETEDAA